MTRSRLTRYAFIVVLLAVVSGVFFFLGYQHAQRAISIKRVTPDQIAMAMADDHFFSDYGESTLVVHGTVASLRKDGGSLVIWLKVDSSYAAGCDLGRSAFLAHAGDAITVLAEGALAERETAAVMLRNCAIP